MQLKGGSLKKTKKDKYQRMMPKTTESSTIGPLNFTHHEKWEEKWFLKNICGINKY